MRINLDCPNCEGALRLSFIVNLLPKNDCVYEILCPNGHTFRANVLYHEFQKLFEVGVNALADDYLRESIGSFAASYERFLELFIRVSLRAQNVDETIIAGAWKKMSKQSERQLGAFVTLFAMQFKVQSPVLSESRVQLRNKVVHQGYFPTRQECLDYGSDVLESIRSVIRQLYTSEPHQHCLIGAINDQIDPVAGPRFYYYAWPLILTNSSPELDTKTLQEMLHESQAQRAARHQSYGSPAGA